MFVLPEEFSLEFLSHSLRQFQITAKHAGSANCYYF
jgi:hypothetical protein